MWKDECSPPEVLKRLLLSPVLFYFLSKCFSQSTPFVHSMKVLSWQFLLFDVGGIGAVCVEGEFEVLTVCEGCRGEGWAASGKGLAAGRGLDRQRGRWREEVWGLPAGVWNSYFVIWNMSEISNEIWSITASHTSQWNALSVCPSMRVCFWKCVVIFILKHWGVRWREGVDEGRRREGREEDFPLELTGLSLSSQVFFLFFFFFHLSGLCQGELSAVCFLCVCMCVVVCGCMCSSLSLEKAQLRDWPVGLSTLCSQ